MGAPQEHTQNAGGHEYHLRLHLPTACTAYVASSHRHQACRRASAKRPVAFPHNLPFGLTKISNTNNSYYFYPFQLLTLSSVPHALKGQTLQGAGLFY